MTLLISRRLLWDKKASTHGFTLIELLIVIACMAVLVSTIFGAVMMCLRLERSLSQRATFLGDILQLDHAWRHDVHNAIAIFPPKTTPDGETSVMMAVRLPNNAITLTSYAIVPDHRGKVRVIRVVSRQGALPGAQTLASALCDAQIRRHEELPLYELKVLATTGYDAFVTTHTFTLLAAKGLDVSEALNIREP
jgi:prepilin-type N-terminal cleavage/methylation domain-containing protein